MRSIIILYRYNRLVEIAIYFVKMLLTVAFEFKIKKFIFVGSWKNNIILQSNFLTNRERKYCKTIYARFQLKINFKF